MQQGRMLLDSDVNALVDAQDTLHRGALSDLGCRAGSPDYGFLVTPGRLLRLFDDPDDLADIDPGGLDMYRAFGERYLGRYPSLYLRNTGGSPSTATIPLRQPTSASQIRLWLKGQGEAAAGGAFHFVTDTSFAPHDIPASGQVSEIHVRLSADQQLWIGLIEEHQSAGTRPAFWIADGVFHLDGLRLTAESSNLWSTASLDALLVDQLASEEQPGFSPSADMLPPASVASGGLVAYLEGWERHLTAAEDLGIREAALGQRLDTCTRTQALGQVKVTPVPAETAPETVLQAFANVQRGDGRLEIDIVSNGLSNSDDPCSLPALNGYTGPDNRLYRIEVHEVTSDAIVLKWSRDNGSRLYPVREWSVNELHFSADNAPEGGDLVEILSEAVALGDQGAAVIDTNTSSFTPPVRQVGELVTLTPSSAKGIFTFEPQINPDDYGGSGAALRARVWHRIEDDRTGQWHTLGDGLKLRLTGTPQVGDYWEYTARVDANGDPRWAAGARPPDGPERLFTPLALLEVPPAPHDQPLELISWLDHRFPRMCELEAGDIPFDGSAVGQDDSTVQEILERLIDREGLCRCEVTLEPADEDLATRISEEIRYISGPVAICLQPGIYPIRSTFTVTDRRVALKGCPDAVLVDEVANAAPLEVATSGLLELVDVTVVSSTGSTGNAIVQVAMDARGVRCRGAGLLAGRADVVAIRVGEPVPTVPQIADWQDSGERILAGEVPEISGTPELELEECVIAATWGIAAETLSGLQDRGSHMEVFEGGVFAVAAAGVDLQRTAIDDGYDPANHGALLDPVDLDADPDPILDSLAASNPSFRGVGLAFGAGEGLLEQCAVRAGVGLYAEQATLEASGNQWRGDHANHSTYGIYLRTATDTVLGQEHITSQVGIHVPDLARGMKIRGCRIDSDHGVILGRQVQDDLAETDTVEQVTIADNHFDFSMSGIRLGPAKRTCIDDNAIRSSGGDSTGISVRTLPSSGLDDMAYITVAGNEIDGCKYAADLHGPKINVLGNRIASDGEYVFSCRDSDRGLFEDNLILMARDSDVFRLEEGTRVRVVGNKVHSEVEHTALDASEISDLEIRGNSFERGMVRVANNQGLTLADNYIGLHANIDSSTAGIIDGNHIDGQDSHDESLRINLLGDVNDREVWIVDNNRTAGWIRILPATRLANFALRACPSAEGLGARRASHAELLGHVARAVEHAMPAEASSLIDFLNSDWKERMISDLDRYIDRVFLREWWSNIDLVAELASMHLGFEYAYEAHVNGNWCQGLQVGHAYIGWQDPAVAGLDTAVPDSSSRIHMTNNRVMSRLVVNEYPYRIVAHNMASAYNGVTVSADVVLTGNTFG